MFFTASHLGLALFSLCVLTLGSLSISKFAPNAPSTQTRSAGMATAPPFWRGAGSRRVRMRLALTLVLGGAAFWIIEAARDAHDGKTWAYGTLAMLLGYWLKT